MKKVDSQKINLLHLVGGLSVGGAEIMLTQYIIALGKIKYNHQIYCFGNNGPVKEKLEELGVHVYFGKKRKSIKNPITFTVSILLLIKDLLKFIKKNQIQIIQSHLSHANQLAIATGILSGIPAFPTIHNTFEFIDKRKFFDPRVILIKLTNEVTFRLADKIISVSDEIKKIVIKKFRITDSKIVVVKNGIVFNERSVSKKYREKDIFHYNNIIKILAVGRLTYQKAMEVLVKAANILYQNGMKNFEVIIVGEGEQRIMLEKLIREFNAEKYIRLLGIRFDVIDLMKSADIFVLPSRYEGLSIAMIEAMACGCPIIATDAPGINAHIKNGVNGLLFHIEDHEKLSEMIKKLITNKILRKKLSDEGKKTYKNEYDMKRNINILDNLFRYHAAK